MNAPLSIKEAVSIRSLAKEALADNNGDIVKAIDTLAERLVKDRKLMREIVSEAVMIASETMVRYGMRSDRSAIVLSATRARNGVIDLANGLRAALLDFPLSSGLRLRDATPDQVSEQIVRYDAIGRDVLHKSRWLSLIVQSVPRNKKIGSVITDQRAQELWEASS